MKSSSQREITYRYKLNGDLDNKLEDYIDMMWKYFSYGCQPVSYYNHHFMKAIELIGRLYYKDPVCDHACSDYHNGINYVSAKAGVKKNEVKSFRKTIRKSPSKDAIQVYHLPYSSGRILDVMVKAIKDKEKSPEVARFFEEMHTMSYRDAFMGVLHDQLQSSIQLVEPDCGRYQTMTQIQQNFQKQKAAYK